MQKITPFLWFNNNAEEAAKFYVSLFKNSRILKATPMMVTFELDGRMFYALNGGPHFKLTEAFSLYVDCKTQEEIDDLWGKLTSNGGEESHCGWLKDKYGLSWQLIPSILSELLYDKDPIKAKRAMDAMLQMGKLDIAKLQSAADGK